MFFYFAITKLQGPMVELKMFLSTQSNFLPCGACGKLQSHFLLVHILVFQNTIKRIHKKGITSLIHPKIIHK